jgi:tetratricopeptide (TPR) repeat protein
MDLEVSWPERCIGCGKPIENFNEQDYQRYDYEFKRTLFIGYFVTGEMWYYDSFGPYRTDDYSPKFHRVKIPVKTYLCSSCKEIAIKKFRRRFWIKFSIFLPFSIALLPILLIPFILFLVRNTSNCFPKQFYKIRIPKAHYFLPIIGLFSSVAMRIPNYIRFRFSNREVERDFLKLNRDMIGDFGLLKTSVRLSGKFGRFYNKGYNAYNKEKYRNALNFFEKAVIINSKDFLVYAYMGYSHLYLENYPKAIECLKRSLVFNPDSIDLWYYLGNSYRLNGEAKKALECYKQVSLNREKWVEEMEEEGYHPGVTISKENRLHRYKIFAQQATK